MPERALFASVSGLAAGVAATIAVTGQGPDNHAGGIVLTMAAGLAAMVSVTVVAMAAVRKWLTDHDERTLNTAKQIAIERSTFIEASERQARELAAREERLNRQAEQISAYVMGIARRLDEALTRNSHLDRQLTDLTKAYEELSEDHNRLVRETLQERAARFQRRPASSRMAAATCPPAQASQETTPVRAYADPNGGHHPVAPIPLRRVPAPASHMADTPQHDRPAEGVGRSV